MRILSGFMPPSAGKVEVAGFDILEQSLDVRRRVGYMPETVPLISRHDGVQFFEIHGRFASFA